MKELDYNIPLSSSTEGLSVTNKNREKHHHKHNSISTLSRRKSYFETFLVGECERISERKEKQEVEMTDPYTEGIIRQYLNVSNRYQNDALVNLFKAYGYEHHGFTTSYDTSSQVRWMGVLNLAGETPASLKKQFDSQRKRNINKAINYGVKVRFLKRDELNIFLDLYRETEARTGFVSKTDEYFYNFIDQMNTNS